MQKDQVQKRKSFEPHHRLIDLLGRSPPPNSAGSTVLNPLVRLLFGLRGGECSSITSTISSSLSIGAVRLVSSTTIVSRLDLGGVLLRSTSITSERRLL